VCASTRPLPEQVSKLGSYLAISVALAFIFIISCYGCQRYRHKLQLEEQARQRVLQAYQKYEHVVAPADNTILEVKSPEKHLADGQEDYSPPPFKVS
jgi:hypothetical protein